MQFNNILNWNHRILKFCQNPQKLFFLCILQCLPPKESKYCSFTAVIVMNTAKISKNVDEHFAMHVAKPFQFTFDLAGFHKTY